MIISFFFLLQRSLFPLVLLLQHCLCKTLNFVLYLKILLLLFLTLSSVAAAAIQSNIIFICISKTEFRPIQRSEVQRRIHLSRLVLLLFYVWSSPSREIIQKWSSSLAQQKVINFSRLLLSVYCPSFARLRISWSLYVVVCVPN